MLNSSRNLHGKQNSCQEAMEWGYKLLLSVQCIPILWFIFTFNRIINHLFPRLPSCICEMWGWPAGRWGASGGDSPGLRSHQAVLAADTRVFSDDTNTLTVVITHWHTDSARLQTPGHFSFSQVWGLTFLWMVYNTPKTSSYYYAPTTY